MAIEKRKYLSLEAETLLQAVYKAPGSPELYRRALTSAIAWQQHNETTAASTLGSQNLVPQWMVDSLALAETRKGRFEVASSFGVDASVDVSLF